MAKASLWMKHKLGASQKILEGMSTGDFDLISKHARAMKDTGYLESWVRTDVPGYKAQMHVFDYTTGAIIDAAEDKNLDGVTLAFNQLTISCVQCHKIIRERGKEQ